LRPARSRPDYGPDEYDQGRRGSPTHRLTRLSISPPVSRPRTIMTRRSPSPEEGTRAPRTHHSRGDSPPYTIALAQDEVESPVQPRVSRRPPSRAVSLLLQ
jgi:hypothetical protein